LIGKAEMTYKVRLTAKANKVYSEADPILKKKIAKCLKLENLLGSIASALETIGLSIPLMIVSLKLSSC